MLCSETLLCHCCETVVNHNDLKGHSKFSRIIYSFSILCLEHQYCGDQEWSSRVTLKLNILSAFVYFRWSWSCYFGLGLVSSSLGLGLKNLVLFTSLVCASCRIPLILLLNRVKGPPFSSIGGGVD